MGLGPGSPVAHYRLERKLGAGGMGEVYLAHDTRLARQVAIKFLSGAADEPSRKRLLREARAAAALDHPGICAVYEVGADPAAGDFIAMQFVEGETLAARLRRGRMPAEEALALAARIAEALTVAHRHGIVHRDLKPQNIVITPGGAPKLLDFGLATQIAGIGTPSDAPTTSQLPAAEAGAGTPGYMAPEQVRAAVSDFRTDLFALGCILYECLTGRRAFSGATSAETQAAILHVDPPPVSVASPDVGAVYDTLCERLLQKDPAERFQSAEEVVGAIRALRPTTHGPVTAAALRRVRMSRTTWWLAAALVVASGAAIGPRIWRGPGVPVPTPEARRWYDRGAEQMRDGTYSGARDCFAEAISQFPSYAQAHARLAEALIALEDERGAREAALKAASLVPNRSRLSAEDALRFDAARESALRQYHTAAAAYRRLVDRQPGDAGRWLDLGRVQEMDGQVAIALVSYLKARELDGSYAAAQLRAAVLLARTGKTDEAFAGFDEAIRLYRAAGQSEGEAQALLGKGIALSSLTKPREAREALDQVMQFAADTRYASQRIRAQFELARLAYIDGAFDTAEAQARQAIAEASALDLPTLAAAGLIDLGNALQGLRRWAEADSQYAEAARLAGDRDAERTAMRARLSQASVKLQIDRPEDALALSDEPMRYFTEAGDARLEQLARSVASRAHEQLEEYAEAERLTLQTLRFAEDSGDEGLVATALDNMAGQLNRQGRLPEALAYRERLDAVTRQSGNQAGLALGLANHAELLILLGRGPEADPLLEEIGRGAADGITAYVDLQSRATTLRMLRASIDRRYAEVLGLASTVGRTTGGRARAVKVLREHALAHVGRPGEPPSVIALWPAEGTSVSEQRDLTFWVAQTLLQRGDARRAYDLAAPVLANPKCQANPELSWRLAAVAAAAGRRASIDRAELAALESMAAAKISELRAGAWAPAAPAYFARADLIELSRTQPRPDGR